MTATAATGCSRAARCRSVRGGSWSVCGHRAPRSARRPPPGARSVTLVTDRVESWSIRDRTPAMDRTIAALLDRAERVMGMPARHAVPARVAGTALQVAVLGMHWDDGYHVD